MTATVIELNDSEIRVARGTDIILRSPGYAVIQENKVILGETAAKLSHLNPRSAYNRYWNNLNQDSLQYPSPQVRHNADLAYAHLLDIHDQAGKPEEVLFAVPGFYSNEQLALLLGLVEASPLTAAGLVDIAVAAAAPVAGSGEYVHIDMHLHQTLLTHISVSDQVTRSSVQGIDSTGLSALYDTCAFLIADLFIKQSRFDPQHHPETEQSLYNQIPECLRSLQAHPEVLLEIQYQETLHQAKLLRDALIDALQPLYQKILSAIPAAKTCLVSDRLTYLPGFVEQLPAIEALDPVSVFRGCQERISSIRSSGSALNFVTRLPATAKPAITTITKTSTPVRKTQTNRVTDYPITHILHGHHAYRLTNGRLYLSATGKTDDSKKDDSHCSISLNRGQATLQPESSLTVFINGKQLNSPAEVQTGDIVSFAGSKTEYTFISVMN